MASRTGITHRDPFSFRYPARSPGCTGRNDAGDPDCFADLGDTPGTTGRGDGAAILAHAWHRHAQGRNSNTHNRKTESLPRRGKTSRTPITIWGITGIPRKPPASIDACPKVLVLPEDFVKELHELYRHSEKTLWNKETQKFSADGVQVEWAQRIVVFRSSEIKLAGKRETSTSVGDVTIAQSQIEKKEGNLWIPDVDYETIGIAHTHPKTDTFSGGDIAGVSNDIADRHDYRMYAVIRKDSIHLLLRTQQTFPGVRDQQRWLDKANARSKELEKNLPHEVAYNKAIAELSTENNVALYVYQRDRFRKIN